MGLDLALDFVPGIFGGGFTKAFVFDGGATEVPVGWTGTWQQNGSGALLPILSLGSELLTDGALENWDSATDLTSWVENVTPPGAINQEDTVIHGDTYAARINNTAGGDVSQFAQALTIAAASWLYFTWWEQSTTGQLRALLPATLSSLEQHTPSTVEYTEYPLTDFTLTANGTHTFRGIGNSAQIYIDDASIKAISGYAMVYPFGSAYGKITIQPTITARTQFGVILNWTDASNYAFVVCNRVSGNIRYVKVVAGTVTAIGSWSFTYAAAGALVVTRHVNGTVDISYNGASIATGQAASGLSGASHGMIGTSAASSVPGFTFTTAGVN